MKIVWDEHYWLVTQGWAYGDGDTRWAAFWDCVRCALKYVRLRHMDGWSWRAVWRELFRWPEEVG